MEAGRLPLVALALAPLLALPAAAQAPCREEVVLKEVAVPGSGPLLRTPKGAPVLGGSFALQVRGAAANRPGLLCVLPFDAPGPKLPRRGGAVSVFEPFPLGLPLQPPPTFATAPFATDAEGNSTLLLDTTGLAIELCGLAATFQALVFEPSAPGGLAVSDAVRTRVGRAQPPYFVYPPQVETLDDVLDVTVSDLNRDGVQDVVILDVQDQVVTYLGDGQGGYVLHNQFGTTGSNPSGVACATLDAGGKPDIVVANTDSHDVSVFLGEGPVGGYSPGSEQRFATGLGPTQVVPGPIDGDAFVDLLVANSQDVTVSVLLGDGAGGFAPASNVFAGAAPSGAGFSEAALADLNGDGATDIVAIALYGHFLSVLLGNGDGTFGPPTQYTTGLSWPRYLAVGDLDGDGAADVVVGFRSPNQLVTTNELRMRRGLGDGTLGPEEALFAKGSGPSRIRAEDLDGEPGLELVYATREADSVSILRHDVDTGGFSRRVFPLARVIESMWIADMDGDGLRDVVTGSAASLGLPPNVTVGLGDGVGGLVGAENIDINHTGIEVLVGDFDGDSRSDLLEAGPDVYLRRGRGGGEFEPAEVQTVGVVLNANFGKRAAADLDGDGVLDIALGTAGSNGGVHYLLGRGDGTFGHATFVFLGPTQFQELFLVDVTGDSRPDLLAETQSGFVLVPWVGIGFGAPMVVVPDAHDAVTWGMLGNDPDPDILFAGKDDGRVYALTNDGTGTFAGPTLLFELGPAVPFKKTHDLDVADFDGDGINDIFVHGDNDVKTTINLGKADGTYAVPIEVSPRPAANEIRFADIDQDGDLDLLDFEDFFSPTWTDVRYNNGDGTFGMEELLSPVAAQGYWADVDDDGIPDLLMRTDSGLGIVLNQLGE